MKIYEATWWDNNTGAQRSWHGSRAKAEEALRQVRKDFGPDESPDPVGVEVHDIPETKAGLIAWLNIFLTTDNG